MEKIAILDTGYTSYKFEQELFARNGYELVLYDGPGKLEAKMKFSRDAVGLLVRDTPLNDTFFEQTPGVKAIVRYGVGVDNINIEDAKASGIRVANVQGYATHSVSEHALAMLLSCTRQLFAADIALKDQFCAPPIDNIFELHDKTLGIIGLGRIGTALSLKASSLFGEVIACDPYIEENKFEVAGAKEVDFDTLLSESDVISLHCSLTDETTYLIDDSAFAIMRKKPVLINTSRGRVIKTAALLKAFEKKQIHCAGLDVFEDEPDILYRDQLLNHPGIVCSGHYAWYSDRASIELQERAALNLLALLNGESCEDELTL